VRRWGGVPQVKSQQGTRGVWIWNVVGGAKQRQSYLGNQSWVTLGEREGWLGFCFMVCFSVKWVCVCVWEEREIRDDFHHVKRSRTNRGRWLFFLVIYESVKTFLHETKTKPPHVLFSFLKTRTNKIIIGSGLHVR